MISGFNTDIEVNGKVYHVQTEDKGLQKRMIMSLVYDGGTILASKRESYNDLAAVNFDGKELADRLGRQHKLICAAVSAGRIDELQQMTANAATKAPKTDVLQEPIAEPAVPSPTSHIKFSVAETRSARPTPPPPPPPPPVQQPVEPVVEVVRVIEEEILPAEAVEVVSELSGQERPANDKLSLELLGDSKFKGGERKTVNLMICRGTARKVVADAQIMVKVLGSSFRPVIFHARSDANGLAKVHLQLPHFQAGRAALLVRAMTGGEEIELRKAVTPG